MSVFVHFDGTRGIPTKKIFCGIFCKNNDKPDKM